ncbi:hypothetical protein KY308_04070 [Candidatus Woesearchaeota archaeon]|nr:hypothetical protein [Candidatus Woesearchaeota archaeon]
MKHKEMKQMVVYRKDKPGITPYHLRTGQVTKDYFNIALDIQALGPVKGIVSEGNIDFVYDKTGKTVFFLKDVPDETGSKKTVLQVMIPEEDLACLISGNNNPPNSAIDSALSIIERAEKCAERKGVKFKRIYNQ